MVRAVLFAAVLVYASAVDIRTRTVPVSVLLLLLAVGLIGVGWSSLEWALIIFGVLFVISLQYPELGGGDVKFSAMCAFVFGDSKILFAILLGLLASIPAFFIYCTIKHKPIKGTSLPLVPFISLGCLIMTFF